MSDVSLPDEILLGIMKILPPKIACRCKLVCKEWLAKLSDKRFVEDNYAYHIKKKNLVALSVYGALFSLIHDDYTFTARRIIRGRRFDAFGGTCDGMCIVADDRGTMYLVNPLVGDRMLIIPRSELALPLSESYSSYSLYKEEQSGDYKVVVISAWSTAARRRSGNVGIVVDLYSTNTRAWRRCNPNVYIDTPLMFHLTSVIGRKVYFIKSLTAGASNVPCLCAFDVEQEAVQMVDTPKSLPQELLRAAAIVDLDGRIGLLTGKGPLQKLWVENSPRGGSHSWTQIDLHELDSRFWTNPISMPQPNLLMYINDEGRISRYFLNSGEPATADGTTPINRFIGAAFYSESIIDPTAIPYVV